MYPSTHTCNVTEKPQNRCKARVSLLQTPPKGLRKGIPAQRRATFLLFPIRKKKKEKKKREEGGGGKEKKELQTDVSAVWVSTET